MHNWKLHGALIIALLTSLAVAKRTVGELRTVGEHVQLQAPGGREEVKSRNIEGSKNAGDLQDGKSKPKEEPADPPDSFMEEAAKDAEESGPPPPPADSFVEEEAKEKKKLPDPAGSSVEAEAKDAEKLPDPADSSVEEAAAEVVDTLKNENSRSELRKILGKTEEGPGNDLSLLELEPEKGKIASDNAKGSIRKLIQEKTPSAEQDCLSEAECEVSGKAGIEDTASPSAEKPSSSDFPGTAKEVRPGSHLQMDSPSTTLAAFAGSTGSECQIWLKEASAHETPGEWTNIPYSDFYKACQAKGVSEEDCGLLVLEAIKFDWSSSYTQWSKSQGEVYGAFCNTLCKASDGCTAPPDPHEQRPEFAGTSYALRHMVRKACADNNYVSDNELNKMWGLKDDWMDEKARWYAVHVIGKRVHSFPSKQRFMKICKLYLKHRSRLLQEEKEKRWAQMKA